MKINYTTYNEKFYNEIKKITLQSFILTSFNTDPKIEMKKSGFMAWELWCKPALESEKRNNCIVALHGDDPVGYIIYGADAGISKILTKKVGNIILMAINKQYQGVDKIGLHLLKYVLDIFEQYDMDIVTTGTDLNNFSAIINYSQAGFKPVLFWTTYRFYFDSLKERSQSVSEIVKLKKEKSAHFKKSTRPISFSHDKRIDHNVQKKVLNYMGEKILRDIKSEKLELYKITCKTHGQALITVLKEETISTALEKSFYRINDIVFFQEDIPKNTVLLKDFLHFIKKTFSGVYGLEIFIRMDDWSLNKVLRKSGCEPVHHAVNMHKFFNEK